MQDLIHNIELNKTEIERKQVVLKSKPTRLMVLLTSRCNLKCIMCHRVKAKEHYTVPFVAIKKIYDLLPFITWINWQGGEVFLVPYFKQLFSDISNYRHIYQTVLTNGLLIDDEWARILAESNTGVTYSIDAVTGQTYEKIRKGAKFDDLVRSVEIMRDYRARYSSRSPLEITAVVMKSNYRELNLFPEFCKKYGFSNLRFDYLHPEIIPEEDVILKRDSEAIKHLNTILPEISIKCKQLGIGFCLTFKKFLEEGSESDAQNENAGPVRIKCKLPWQQFTVIASEKGEVQPDCACIHTVGNLMDNTVEEIWNSEKMQLYRKNLLTDNARSWCAKKCLIDMGCYA